MISNFLIVDIATTALDNVAAYLDGEVIQAPANWKDPVKIAAYVAEKQAERIERAALDPDLGRISAIGFIETHDRDMTVRLCKDEDEERRALDGFRIRLQDRRPALVGYNALAFDWPFLQRRALYL